jgi:hypothetical protein
MNSEEQNNSKLLHDFHLTEDDLSNDAKDKFPFHAEIINSLNFVGHSILMNENLTPAGRHILCSKILRRHENTKSVFNYLASTPTQSQQKNYRGSNDCYCWVVSHWFNIATEFNGL